MTIHACRVCGREFFPEPLLRYENMPGAAQNFPDASALAADTGVDLTLCQCSGCGLAQLAGEPVPYYREVIRAAGISRTLEEAKLRQFTEFVEKHGLKGKKIIEIGCGRGEFLSVLARLDVNAYGLEYSEASVVHCLKNGLKVSRGYVESASQRLEHAPFDAFLVLMFLEHMPRPNDALLGIHANLTENGVGLIEVPNFDMILRSNLFSEFTSDHLCYFSRETLGTTLHLNGFEIVEFNELRDDYVLSAVVRKRRKLDVTCFADRQAGIKAALDAFIAQFPEKKVAIWGAGHQALAIIAMTGIAGKIRYVVDSAPFKQGKFTPATHLPVVAPDTLRSIPVDAVIIMAGAYSDEVVGVLRKQFDPKIRVAIFREHGLDTQNPEGVG
jgi:cyclopropane fatty-acyl-phospholipid synthase-like methyltransferase